MRKRRLLYDASYEGMATMTARYTRPVFDDWRELIDFLSDVDVGLLKVEENCSCVYPFVDVEYRRSIAETLKLFGEDNVIVYIDRVGEFKIEYKDEDAYSVATLSVADERFPGDVTPLGAVVEEYLKYVC